MPSMKLRSSEEKISRSTCLFGKTHFPIALKLSIEVTTPRWIIANAPEARQFIGL